MILFSGNNQNYSSIRQNSGDSYHSMVNATIESGVYYHIRITVSEMVKSTGIFFQCKIKKKKRNSNFTEKKLGSNRTLISW